MVTYEKKSDSVLVKVYPAISEERRIEYDIDALDSQLLAVLTSLNNFVAARKLELAELYEMIAESEKLGIKRRIKNEIVEAELQASAILKES